MPVTSTLLKKGSTGEAVRSLQQKLIALGYLTGTADGKYGDAMPLKYYYLISCFRHEAPQAGRSREFLQFGTEMFGSESAAADATIIAEYAIGLAMSLLYRIPESVKKLRRGVWRDRVNPYWKSFFEVKIGLVGYGHIGKAIHAFLKRNNITAYTLDRGKDYGSDIEVLPTLEALCEVSDLIILSLPKTPGTDRMFDQHLLSAMQGKYLVNVGRSNCIDQQALYHALKDGQLAGAAIDTWDQKPASMLDTLIPFAYPFDQLDNIILSPHQAMQVEAGHENYVEDITQKVLRYLQGQPPTDVVDLNKGY